jgi:hypothetical protein
VNAYEKPILKLDDKFSNGLLIGTFIHIQGSEVSDYADDYLDQTLPLLFLAHWLWLVVLSL